MKEPEPRICVTIPFFTDLGHLAGALRSLVEQDDGDWTAVVVDDCSQEIGAAGVVAELNDRRVRSVRNDANLGIAANFDRCLDLGRQQAEIVSILHADDLLEPGYVAAIREAHRAFPTATCVAPRVTVIDGAGRPVRTLADSVKGLLWPRRLPFVLEGDRGLARLLTGQFFYCPAVSYRVDLLPDLRFDPRWQQVMDLDLYARVLLGGGSIVLVADRVYRYRRHATSATARNTRSAVRSNEEAAACREIVDAARHRHWRRSVRAGRLRVTVRLNDWWSRTR